MFNIYVLGQGCELPEEDNCYVIAENGIFFKKKMGVVSGLVKVDKISFLQTAIPDVQIHCPKIPKSILGRILSFMKDVYDTYGGESVAVILFNPETNHFDVQIPQQIVSSSAINYTSEPSPDGYLQIGTFHSHPGFGAFHSGTDTSDEQYGDGIHFTVGNVKKFADNKINIVGSIALNGNRKKIDPCDYVEGIGSLPKKEEKKEEESKSGYWTTDSSGKRTFHPFTYVYTSYNSDAETYELKVPLLRYSRKKWLSRVQKHVAYSAYTTKTDNKDVVVIQPKTRYWWDDVSDSWEACGVYGYGYGYGDNFSWDDYREGQESPYTKYIREKREASRREYEDMKALYQTEEEKDGLGDSQEILCDTCEHNPILDPDEVFDTGHVCDNCLDNPLYKEIDKDKMGGVP